MNQWETLVRNRHIVGSHINHHASNGLTFGAVSTAPVAVAATHIEGFAITMPTASIRAFGCYIAQKGQQ